MLVELFIKEDGIDFNPLITNAPLFNKYKYIFTIWSCSGDGVDFKYKDINKINSFNLVGAYHSVIVDIYKKIDDLRHIFNEREVTLLVPNFMVETASSIDKPEYFNVVVKGLDEKFMKGLASELS